MSRASRLALAALVLALVLAPLLTLHPAVAHLYEAGLGGLRREASHPQVVAFSALTVISVFPATAFLIFLIRAARCQDELGQTDQAVQTLNQVIDDHEAITPDSSEYRQALIELGKLYHRMGKDDPVKYARAIELLTEAVQRKLTAVLDAHEADTVGVLGMPQPPAVADRLYSMLQDLRRDP